jgi:multiple sugar transport system permease protein
VSQVREQRANRAGETRRIRPGRPLATRRRLQPRAGRAVGLTLAAIGAAVVLVVLVYALLTSFKAPAEALRTPIQWLPKTPRWGNYAQPFDLVAYGRYLINSGIVGVSVTCLNVVTCTLAGFSLAKIRFPGRNIFFAIVMITLMIPVEVIYVPLYQLVYQLGWVNSYAGLILPAGTSAFGVFLMRQAIISVPDELLEAARIDGAGTVRTLVRIVVPMVKGPVATMALFIFMTNWDSFLWPLLVASSDSFRTVPVGLAAMQSEFGTSYPVMMAAAFMSAAPTVLLFIFLQRRFVSGVLAVTTQK